MALEYEFGLFRVPKDALTSGGGRRATDDQGVIVDQAIGVG